MMNRIPTGMFMPGESIIHCLDARAKLLSLIILLAALVSTDSLIGYAVVIALITIIILLSKLSFRTAVASVGRMYIFFVIILLMNTCFFSSEDAYFSFWILHPSFDGFMQGINVVFRVMLVIVLSNVLTSTTSPMEVTNALERLISPLRCIKIPTEQIAMIISVAIQFIPTLTEESDMIKKAQTARGARFDSRKLTDKAAAVMPLVIPIFLGAFKRADELSIAMEARGYRSAAGRTRKMHRPMRYCDFAGMLAAAVICLGLILFQ